MTRLIFGPMRLFREDAAAGAGANNGSHADVAGDRPGTHADAASAHIESHIIGIDAGSKTIKIVVFDSVGNLVYSGYHRHYTDICSTLADAFHDVRWRLGDIDARIAVTGSAGIEVARLLDVPFVQEVVSVTRAVEHACPDADVIIELGGEDSKIVYLGDDLEQRMNSTCAGGTGGFIDSIAYMLGVRASEMGSLALGASSTYPIASRCAVFAQTDVRPLLNAGASKADIAASVHDAVVRQTLGGLACGRPIEGKVVFLGGPLQFNDGLVFSFRRTLGLSSKEAVKPHDAHLFTVFDAAMAAEESAHAATVGSIEGRLRGGAFVLDIGGQDMKALWISDGQVADAVLNEACSSGCGSFLGGTAHAVGKSEISFAECALRSESPVDLGTKCTVFMSSRVKHAQKMGVGVEDIAAGCAYSVVQNVLHRIIGSERVASIGEKVAGRRVRRRRKPARKPMRAARAQARRIRAGRDLRASKAHAGNA